MTIAQASNRALAKGPDALQQPDAQVEVREGSDYFLFNALRNIVSIPLKLIYWNSAYGSGNVSPAVVDKVTRCLEDYGLENVAVQVNDYSPIWYASRVFTNPKTSLLAKLVFGVPVVICNALGLSKILSYDRYDVFSNSVYIISDDPDVALLEAGSAKSFNDSSAPVFDFAVPIILNSISLACGPFYPVISGVALALSAGCKLALNHAGHDAAIDWAKKKSAPDELVRTYTVQNPIASAPLIGLASAVTALFTMAINKSFKDPLVIAAAGQMSLIAGLSVAVANIYRSQASQIRKEAKVSA